MSSIEERGSLPEIRHSSLAIQNLRDVRERKKIGLALGSGSARGCAHIGVIKALEDARIEVDCVAGTSMGALVGAIYATGALDALEAFMLGLDWKKIVSYFDVVFPRTGLLDGEKVYELVAQHVITTRIEEGRIPFCAIASDLATGQEVRIESGNVVDAVRASISLPGIFTPFESEGRYFVDGGMVNPVPVSAVRAMGADLVIAVDLNHDAMKRHWAARKMLAASEAPPAEEAPPGTGILNALEERYRLLESSVREKVNQWIPDGRSGPNIFDVIATSINIMENRITQANLQICKPDFLIQPALGHLGLFDFDKAQQAIDEGYDQTMQRVDQIRAAL